MHICQDEISAIGSSIPVFGAVYWWLKQKLGAKSQGKMVNYNDPRIH